MRNQRTVRARAEYIGGSTVRYHYPCGHYRTQVMLNGAPGPRGKLPADPNIVKMLVQHWSGTNSVAVPLCTTCKKKQ